MSQSMAIIFENGQGLKFVCQDFGGSGIKVSMQDDTTNDIQAMILGGKEIGQLLEWLANTTGRPSMALPPQSREVLQSILDDHKSVLDTKQKRVTKKIIASLDSLVGSRTATGKSNSKSTRSLMRATKMPCRSL